MHVKINIPKPRAHEGRGYIFRKLEPPSEHYTVPIERVMLKENEYSYEEASSSTLNHYGDNFKTITRYWICCPEIIQEWAEIHREEYARLSKLMKKLNLIEIDGHNKKAHSVGARECIFSDQDVRLFYRDGIVEELEELEELSEDE